jgi:hypothetical protein
MSLTTWLVIGAVGLVLAAWVGLVVLARAMTKMDDGEW